MDVNKKGSLNQNDNKRRSLMTSGKSVGSWELLTVSQLQSLLEEQFTGKGSLNQNDNKIRSLMTSGKSVGSWEPTARQRRSLLAKLLFTGKYPQAKYEMDGRSCPMCAAGSRVYWHCTHDASTTCVPCPKFTYTDEPNVLLDCLNCTECDSEQGLRESKACTRSSDTVCEPLESFFCIERYKDGCRFALKYSECTPGQYIKHAGTGSTDTVCADCKDDTYSNGSFSSCKPHTKCGALGLTEVKPGTQSSDTECGNPSTAAAIPLSFLALIIIIIIIIVVSVFTRKHIQRKKRSRQSGIQETGNYVNEKASMVAGGGKNADQFELEQALNN